MKPSEIIAKAAHQAGIDPAEAVRAASIKIQKEKMVPVKNKESLMLFKPVGNGVGAAYFISADSHLNMLSAFKHFHNLLQKDGIHSVFMGNQNKLILNSLAHSGFDISRSNSSTYPLVASV